MSETPDTRPIDQNNAWSRHLRCACHLLAAIHFALSGTSSVALVTLLLVYAATALALLHPALHLGSLTATLLLLPTLNILILLGDTPIRDDIPRVIMWGAFALVPVGVHYLLYVMTMNDTKTDNAMLTMDVMYALILTGFVLYQHHPASLATFAAGVVRHGWFIGIAGLAVCLIAAISYGIRK